MSEHLHQHAPHEEMHPTVEPVLHADELHEGASPAPSKMLKLASYFPIPMPITTNRIILAVWLMRNVWFWAVHAVSSVWSFVRKHPWQTLGGMAATGGCWMLCEYFGGMVLAGELYYAFKNGKDEA